MNTYYDAQMPIFKLIERVDGEWTDLITAGVPWMDNKQIDYNRKKRIFHSERPAKAYRDKLVRQGREVRLVRYVAESTIN